MNEGKLISKLVQSEGKVHNLTREIEELKSKLESTEKQLSLYSVSQQRELLFCKCGLQKGGTFSCMRTDCDSIDLDTK